MPMKTSHSLTLMAALALSASPSLAQERTPTAAPPPASSPAPPPAATALWSIGSADCISVHADGEPWDECGFQALAMNADGSRVLTVSTLGTAQLFDADGRELARVEWPDEFSGASGYPSGRVAIVGTTGVAVLHHNQLVLLDLSTGAVRLRKLLPVMTVRDLRVSEGGLLLAEVYDKEWSTGLYRIDPESGEARRIAQLGLAGFDDFPLHVAGTKAPFAVRPAEPGQAPGARSWGCRPIAGHFCFRRDLPGRFVHVVDARTGGGRSVDAGRSLGQFDGVWFAVAGDRPFAVICGRAPSFPRPRPCEILDMTSGRRIYAFTADNLRVDGGVDESGAPELRLTVTHGVGKPPDQRRVSIEGKARSIDPQGRANLLAPGGGMLLPRGDGKASILIDAAGREAALLPFPAHACGNGWPDWWGWCRISADGTRWLVPAPIAATDGRQDHRYTLYAVPLRPGAAPVAPAMDGEVLHFPRQATEGLYMEALFKGRLSVHNGCLVLGMPPGRTILWNRDARLAPDRRSVTDGRTGRRVAVGERIRLGGGLVELDEEGRKGLAEPFPQGCPTELVVVGESFEKDGD
jgi:hypothetical protein